MKISDLSSAKIRGIMLLFFFISICIKDDDFKIWKERNDIFILMLLNEIICTALKRNFKWEKGNGENYVNKVRKPFTLLVLYLDLGDPLQLDDTLTSFVIHLVLTFLRKQIKYYYLAFLKA